MPPQLGPYGSNEAPRQGSLGLSACLCNESQSYGRDYFRLRRLPTLTQLWVNLGQMADVFQPSPKLVASFSD
jgi:hypothetical protein